ncbi:MAG: hypothetical protein II547_05370, partial [Treponema sp.]|nr:hypothetical protein [Treponema sp.]
MEENTQRRKAIHSLKLKIVLAIAVSALILTVTMAAISLSLYTSNSRKEHIKMAQGAVELAAKC